MTKARDLADFKLTNISDDGTGGTKVASGTTAERGSTTGQIRFNSTTGLAEYYNGSEFKSIDSPPIASSVNLSNVESSSLPANIVITGSSFNNASVKFIGNDGTEYTSASVTTNSGSQVTAQIPTSVTSANEPFDVKLTNTSGLSSTIEDAFNVDASPVFGVAAGSLGSLADTGRAASNLTAITASDDEGDTVTFSITTGSAPAGLTFNSNGTWSGTANQVSSLTTSTFTVTASDGTNTTTRQYTITVNPTVASGGTTNSYTIGSTNYISHTFLSSGTFTLNANQAVDYMIVAGGGSGGSHNIVSSTGAGGGGAGGFRTFTSVSLTAGSFTATVGTGGTAGVSSNGGSFCTSGVNSTFNSQTSTGGGRGGARNNSTFHDDTTSFNAASNGGSGGGTGYDYPTASGNGNTPSTSPSQGHNGGTGTSSAGYLGGGGGGSGADGGSYGGTQAGHGGAGTNNNYRTGSNIMYAAGGGAGAGAGTNYLRGNGGSSIGGSGGDDNDYSTAATQNTGSGGGGAGGASNYSQATAGANGIIVIRYAV